MEIFILALLITLCIWLMPFILAGTGIILCLVMALGCWIWEQLTSKRKSNK